MQINMICGKSRMEERLTIKLFLVHTFYKISITYTSLVIVEHQIEKY
jgi:hypothetical protein